jgi:hypothetical protein
MVRPSINVTINQDRFKRDLGDLFDRLKDMPEFREGLIEKLLSGACPFIEQQLKSGYMLQNRMGKKMFYDTESPIERAKHGLKPPYDEVHLMDQWTVSYEMTGKEFGSIIINNTKMVNGRDHLWNLAELLYNGTHTYVADTGLSFINGELNPDSPKYLGQKNIRNFFNTRIINKLPGGGKYKRSVVTGSYRIKKGEFHPQGRTIYNKSMRDFESPYELGGFPAERFGRFEEDYSPKKMSFYHRYLNKFCRNVRVRRGLEQDGEIVVAFRRYIEECAYNGLTVQLGLIEAGL